MTRQIDPTRPATPAENALIWEIPSRSDPHSIQRVELDSFSGNGECSCTDFHTRFFKLLSQGLTGEQAVAQGLITPKQMAARSYQNGPKDALRCWHIIEARRQLCDHLVNAFAHAQKIHTPGQTHAA